MGLEIFVREMYGRWQTVFAAGLTFCQSRTASAFISLIVMSIIRLFFKPKIASEYPGIYNNNHQTKKDQDLAYDGEHFEAKKRMSERKAAELEALRARWHEISIELGEMTLDGKIFGSDVDRILFSEKENKVLHRKVQKNWESKPELVTELLQIIEKTNELKRELGIETLPEKIARCTPELGLDKNQVQMIAEGMKLIIE